MTLDEFKDTLKDPRPPDGISGVLQALWWDGKGKWDQAHKTAQDIHTSSGAWVHAYLHRKEGDEGNAGYWYTRAGKPRFAQSLQTEWDQIVEAFLKS